MIASTVLSVLVAASAATLGEPAPSQQTDAAYALLAEGETENAVARLEQELVRHPDDPALLLNLGAAYARLGRVDEARTAFRAAIRSDERYSVELADGSWQDSRAAAREALSRLDRTVAMR